MKKTYSLNSTCSLLLMISFIVFMTFEQSGVFAQCSVTVGQKNDSCAGSCNGTAYVTATTGISPYTYIWNLGGQVGFGASVSNLCAGTYSVILHDNAGCTSQETVTITQPKALGITTSSFCVLGQNPGTATATVTGGTPAYSYVWSNGGTAQTTSSQSPGSFTVTVTDSKGCSMISTEEISICEGINQVSDPVSFSLYPNPAKNQVFIDVSGNTGLHYGLTFYDILGNTLYKSILTETHTELNVSAFPPGIYFAELREENTGNVSRKKVLLR